MSSNKEMLKEIKCKSKKNKNVVKKILIEIIKLMFKYKSKE